MNIYSYKEVVKKLKDNGWSLDRTNGSHEIYKHYSGKTCPIKCNKKDIPKGTLLKISRLTGVKFD